MKQIKKILNNFAILLYNKTKEEIQTPEQCFHGFKLIASEHIPMGQIVMSTADTKELDSTLIDREISEITNKLIKNV